MAEPSVEHADSLDEWEFVDTGSSQPGKGGSGPVLFETVDDDFIHVKDEDSSPTSPDGNSNQFTLVSNLTKPTKKTTSKELYPCISCHSYHYVPECVYLFTWTAWLEYHAEHLSSQPYVFSSNDDDSEESQAETLAAIKVDTDYTALREQAAQLDDSEWHHRPNYLSNTQLKADLMTKSSRDMFWEDERWQRKLDKKAGSASSGVRTYLPQSIEEQQLMVWEADLAANEDSEEDDVDEVEEFTFPKEEADDADELGALREDLGRHLPRTSWATLSPPKKAEAATAFAGPA